MISIRPEKITDAASIRRVLEAAFGRPAEAAAVESLRARHAIVLSLAALRAEMVVGAIQFTDAHLDGGASPKWRDEPTKAAGPTEPLRPAHPPPLVRHEEPRVVWMSLEEEFERERLQREMNEVLEAARTARATPRKPQANITTHIAPHAGGAAPAPKLVVLAPVGVMPNLQRRGIGSRLIQGGLIQLTRMNAEAVFVLGDPAYYRRFGFTSTRPFGIGCEFPVKDDVFQVRELRRGALDGVKGVVRFEPEFRELD